MAYLDMQAAFETIRKVCNECGECKPIACFRRLRSKDIESSKCKACEAVKYREWIANNGAWVRLKDRIRYRRDHPKVIARRLRYYRANTQKELARNKQWRERNPEHWNSISYSYRARKLGSNGSHTGKDVKRIWAEQGEKCAVAECPFPIAGSGQHKYHVDHIMPLKLGGTDNADNLQILCRFHNESKGSKHPDIWKQRLAGVIQ